MATIAEQNVHFQLLNLGQMLHIDEVEEQHVGRYSCLAENLPGRAEKDIVVSLLSGGLGKESIKKIESYFRSSNNA